MTARGARALRVRGERRVDGKMRAAVGDRIVVASTVVDRLPRDGRVIEVRHADGSPPYLVEWSDTGEVSLVFPGPDTHVSHEEHADRAPSEPPRAAKAWTVTVAIAEDGDETTATAVLTSGAGDLDGPADLDAVGHARRNPRDAPEPAVGDEVAVSRALRHLADRLLEIADSSLHGADPAHGPLVD
jgi:hypothetical protein